MPRVTVLAIASIVATGLVLAPQLRPRESDEGGRPEHVILIDWDGFDPEFLGRAPMPSLDALVRRGSLSVGQSTYPTISNPARASMVTGAYPERHGNLAHHFDPVSGTTRGQDRTITAQTVTEALAAQGRTAACVQWYMVEDRGVAAGDPRHLYVEPGGAFADRVSVAIDIINRRPVLSGGVTVTVPAMPDFLAVYGDDLDALAHREGTDGANLGPLLEELDRQLGRLVQATKDLGVFGLTAFVLTADHGMTNWSLPVPADALAALAASGYHTEVVPAGAAPAADTDVVVVADSVRSATIALRGRAATSEGRDAVRAALATLAPTYVSRILDATDLRALHTGTALGDFVVEAQPPYGFAPSSPPPGQARASHGSTAELPIPLVLSGPGFRPGFAPADPKLVDVAPTIAALLGVRAPAQAQGRALTQTLPRR